MVLVQAAETSKHPAKKVAIHKVAAKAPASRMVRRVVMVNGKRRVLMQRVAIAPIIPERLSAGELAGLNHGTDALDLKSNVAYVVDQASSQVLFEKNSEVSLPIASITKLMTSLVVVEANQDMNEMIEVTNEDIDKEKGTGSRLKIGAKLSRADMLHIALMSSENRAASALGRNYPGGLPAFVAAMNTKAAQLGMSDTHYVDSSGLSPHNVASARDLAKLVNAAYQQPVIRQYSTDSKYVVEPGGRPLQYSTSNHLVANPGWEIGLQKTGYIAEAGRCLVMQAMIEGRAIVMVFLDSKGKYSRQADAGRIRKWLETLKPQV
ncbi:MAG: D-alanyl-D-alanine endopeptidase [Pseudomonadota bacterium]